MCMYWYQKCFGTIVAIHALLVPSTQLLNENKEHKLQAIAPTHVLPSGRQRSQHQGRAHNRDHSSIPLAATNWPVISLHLYGLYITECSTWSWAKNLVDLLELYAPAHFIYSGQSPCKQEGYATGTRGSCCLRQVSQVYWNWYCVSTKSEKSTRRVKRVLDVAFLLSCSQQV